MRRKNQSQRRNANAFNLQPIPEYVAIRPEVIPVYSAAPKGVASTSRFDDESFTVTPFTWDTSEASCFNDPIIEGSAPEPTTPIYIRIKPGGSNAWPWNKKLPCCGKIEKQCTCGDARYYEVQE